MNISLKNLDDIQSARIEHQKRLNQLGIDENFISQLVDTFYDKVRNDKNLKPIFNSKISDWGVHLAKMKRFWKSIILKENVYNGKPVQAHTNISGVKTSDFDTWLSLFKETLSELTDKKEIHEIFIEPAERMAQRFSSSMTLDD